MSRWYQNSSRTLEFLGDSSAFLTLFYLARLCAIRSFSQRPRILHRLNIPPDVIHSIEGISRAQRNPTDLRELIDRFCIVGRPTRMCEENVNRKSREIFLSATRSTGYNRPWSSLIHFATRASQSTRGTNKTSFFFRQTLSAIYQQCQSVVSHHVRRRLSDFFPLLLFWFFSLHLNYTQTQSLIGDLGSASWKSQISFSSVLRGPCDRLQHRTI